MASEPHHTGVWGLRKDSGHKIRPLRGGCRPIWLGEVLSLLSPGHADQVYAFMRTSRKYPTIGQTQEFQANFARKRPGESAKSTQKDSVKGELQQSALNIANHKGNTPAGAKPNLLGQAGTARQHIAPSASGPLLHPIAQRSIERHQSLFFPQSETPGRVHEDHGIFAQRGGVKLLQPQINPFEDPRRLRVARADSRA